ncbi:3-deoxy-D-manno-octulosonic-acid transferase [Candidatus Magnetobacterium bavaricum]|uniref:3-deoxy-D-manno-octulosonic acid transferase n=1 Tax=Candidatus Magnetobacterium bavaricum TaxID=29290 RepID=A0A0F3H3N1_9BACT|nr:3-deoxy-D-manno-octulosonic-acid transferase [Candidatus Magnetobacterium bavaricum]
MMFLYNALYAGALAMMLPFEYLKRPESLRNRWLSDRCGNLPSGEPGGWKSKDAPVVWLHAVSVGEVISAIPLVKKILQELTPNVVVSTVTDTGQAVAKQRLQDSVRLIYIPFDLPHTVRRAVKRLRPDIFIAMETELWPEVFHVMHQHNTPVMVLNGRISSKSYEGYRKIRFFMKDVLSMVTLFGMQNEVYAQRIIGMGADEGRVKVVGNLKYDIEPPTVVPAWAGQLSGPVIVAGSTHEGEEEIVLTAFRRLREQFAGLTLVIAPRHPQRFDEAERLIKRAGLRCFRRSMFAGELPPVDVILLDGVGELAAVYGAGQVAVMGGSFVPKGGHNLLEPASWGAPILCGPHMDNFPMTEEFIRQGAVIAVTADRLHDSLETLIGDKALCQRMGHVARGLYARNSGALARCVEEIARVLAHRHNKT